MEIEFIKLFNKIFILVFFIKIYVIVFLFIGNNLTDVSATYIKELLLCNDTITELYLHWNKIKGNGGEFIFDGIASNSSLKV